MAHAPSWNQNVSTCRLGATLRFAEGDPMPKGVEPGEYRWCNTHLAVANDQHVLRNAARIDSGAPYFGHPVSLQYPSDSYAFVVVGGSPSGGKIVVARVNGPQDVLLDSAACLASVDLTDIRVVHAKGKGYGEYHLVRQTRTHLAREV